MISLFFMPGARRAFVVAVLTVLMCVLAGCQDYVIKPGGMKVPATVYTYELAIDAHKANAKVAAENANMAATCDDAVKAGAPETTPLTDIGQAVEALRTIGGLAVCGQRVAKADTAIAAPLPVYVAPPSALDRTFQVLPLVLRGGEILAGMRATDQQNKTAVILAQENTKREVGLLTAATGSNERISNSGSAATTTIATTGFNALRDSSTANTAAASQNAAAFAAAMAAATAKPTTQITVGGNYTQAGRDIDQSVTGGHRVQDSEGVEVEVTRPIICTATGGEASAILGGLTASTTGATSALNPGYNPVVSVIPARTSNNCGNG